MSTIIYLCTTNLGTSRVWPEPKNWFTFIPMHGWLGRGWTRTRPHGNYYLMNMMSKDSNYSSNEDINDDPLAGPKGNSSGPLDNNSIGGHGARNLGLTTR